MPASEIHEETAAGLKARAHQLIAQSHIMEVLKTHFGSCALVGSVDLDLMTWRDIDLCVPVTRSQLECFLAATPALQGALRAANYTPFRMIFNDEWSRPRGDYGRGYYLGFRIADPQLEVWKLDLWGWDNETYADKLREHEELKRALAGADRRLILELKHGAMKLPSFRDSITSYDIYRFVLTDSGRSIDQLLSFCATRRAP